MDQLLTLPLHERNNCPDPSGGYQRRTTYNLGDDRCDAGSTQLSIRLRGSTGGI